MLIRINKHSIINSDIAERISCLQSQRKQNGEPLWYLFIYWVSEDVSALALKDQSSAGGSAIMEEIMAASRSGETACDLTPFLLSKNEEEDLIREIQQVKSKIRSGDPEETELVN